jgi:hypothetical protein
MSNANNTNAPRNPQTDPSKAPQEKEAQRTDRPKDEKDTKGQQSDNPGHSQK